MEGPQLRLTGQEQLRLSLLPVLVIVPQSCRDTGPCFSNTRGTGGAWEGWIMSLEIEKQSHFECQAH